MAFSWFIWGSTSPRPGSGPLLTFPYFEDVSLVYHESTFLDELSSRAKSTDHSTAKEAGMAARRANAKKLIIGHFSARYKDLTPLRDEARAEFPNTDLALEGKVFDLRKDV